MISPVGPLPLRVAVLDDHPAVRAGVRAIVESTPDLRHVGDAAGEDDLWPLLRAARPDVLLIDLRHPGRDGLALAAVLSSLDEAPRVVLHTAARSDELTVAAALAGVTATVGKGERRLALLDTIRAAGEPGARHERLDPFARGRVLAHLEPPDRAIAAMQLVDTPVTGIAEALRMAPSEVGRRIEAVLQRLIPRPPAWPRAGPPPGTVAT